MEGRGDRENVRLGLMGEVIASARHVLYRKGEKGKPQTRKKTPSEVHRRNQESETDQHHRTVADREGGDTCVSGSLYTEEGT